MARTKNPLFSAKVRRGKIAPGFILKTRGEKAFICKCPDMSNVVPSELQLEHKDRFRAAVEYARSIVNDPYKKAAYKARKGSTVYHSAIKDYLENN